MSLRAFASAVPSLRQTAEDIAAATGGDAVFIRDKIGLRERAVLAPGETGVGLSTVAVESLFAAHPDLKAKADLIVTVTQTPDYRIPHNSARLAHVLGMPASIASFDLSLGCSGYVYGVVTLLGFLNAANLKNAILVTCDPYSRIIDPADRDTNSLFGDAATATWISADREGGNILALDFGTDGAGWEAIGVKGGGAVAPFLPTAGGLRASDGDLTDSARLHMQGRAVFNFVNTRVPQSIRACLDRAGLTINDIDYFALHQGSIYMLDAMANRVGIPADRLLKNMATYGNTVSSTIPLLLEELASTDQLDGKKVLLSGFGVGLSWATAIVQF
jgi:3-oxoacyl-[acyl-carrier-protein] synthase III